MNRTTTRRTSERPRRSIHGSRRGQPHGERFQIPKLEEFALALRVSYSGLTLASMVTALPFVSIAAGLRLKRSVKAERPCSGIGHCEVFHWRKMERPARARQSSVLSQFSDICILAIEIRTDVCEVQLYDCTSSATALAIALALREAIARRIGVDPDEMGFAAPAAPSQSGKPAWSAVIFDAASGGAGFASTIVDDRVAMLRDARDLLDCQGLGRCGACPQCVLGPDSQHSVEKTDRKSAFVLLSAIARRLALPPKYKFFGEDSIFEGTPIAETIDARLNRDPKAKLVVFLSGLPEEWELESWPLGPVMVRWGGRMFSYTPYEKSYHSFDCGAKSE